MMSRGGLVPSESCYESPRRHLEVGGMVMSMIPMSGWDHGDTAGGAPDQKGDGLKILA